MKAVAATVAILSWWFILANGINRDYAHIIGPFKEKVVCEKVAAWLLSVDSRFGDTYHEPKASICWEDGR